MKTIKKEVVTIQDLANAYHSKDHLAYRNLINNSGISKQLKGTLIQRQGEKHITKNPNLQEQYIENIKSRIHEQNEEMEQIEYAFQNAQKKLKKAQAVLKKEKFLKMVQDDVKKQEQRKNLAQSDKHKLEETLSKEEKKLKKMKIFALVHPTATVNALDKNSETTIVCTKFDSDNMQYGIFADIIANTSKEDFFEREILEDARKKFSSKEEFQSAIEYVKLVFEYWANDRQYKLLYNSEGINYILEKIFKDSHIEN